MFTRQLYNLNPSRAALIEVAIDRFRKAFGGVPGVVASAPGRVNLIGEHTDYNEGFVLPIAVGHSIAIAARPREDNRLVVRSETFDATVEVSLEAISQNDRQPWVNYIAGVALLIRQTGNSFVGADLCIMGDIPPGAGMGSSAALEVAAAFIFRLLNNVRMYDRELVILCQQAENEFVGVQCGIMDQFVSAFAEVGCALFIDCRSLEFNPVRFPAGVSVIVCDTGVRRELAGSEYNRRREECAHGTKLLAEILPGTRALRDVPPAEFEKHRSLLPQMIQKRCRHVISENERVLKAVEALERNDLSTFGKLMYESHMSLKRDYEVSCPELDAVVDICAESDGVFGARMTGAGFGGSAVCLVANSHIEETTTRLSREYPLKTGKTPLILVCDVDGGAFVRRLQ